MFSLCYYCLSLSLSSFCPPSVVLLMLYLRRTSQVEGNERRKWMRQHHTNSGRRWEQNTQNKGQKETFCCMITVIQSPLLFYPLLISFSETSVSFLVKVSLTQVLFDLYLVLTREGEKKTLSVSFLPPRASWFMNQLQVRAKLHPYKDRH